MSSKLWAWGHSVNLHGGHYGIPWESKATPVQGAKSFHANRILMVLPPTEEDAAQVAGFDEVIWQIRTENGFDYSRPLDTVKGLARKYRSIKGVIIDDLTTLEIQRGMTPEDLAKVRQQVKSGDVPLELWGVLYTMNFDIPRLSEYMELLDVVTLWTWRAEHLVDLEPNLTRAEQIAKGKPIVHGVYVYDFGGSMPMPMDMMRLQCDLAEKWLREGRTRGAILLATCNSDYPDPAVEYAKQWSAEMAAKGL